jgi:hypothetical protein
MENVQTDLRELKQQGAVVAELLKTMTETLKGLQSWMPQVDGAGSLQKFVGDVCNRVEVLKATRAAHKVLTSWGGDLGVDRVGMGSSFALGCTHTTPANRDKRLHPIKFDIGEHFGREDDINGSTILESQRTRNTYNTSGQRMPKTEFPKFDGDN